uniref:Hexamerin-like protein 5 n=1 Tax=Xya japonica TaxID=1661859 RepID=A0A2I6SDC9_9ORTH|nr:hexamerin-like protein 5 [Xya japonica]
MKLSCAFLALAVVALAAASPVPKKTLDKDTLMKQKMVYKLLFRVSQDELLPDLHERGTKWVLEEHKDVFTKPEIVDDFLVWYKEASEPHYLARGEPFSLFYTKHREYAIKLFKLFFFAKDFDTFMDVAVWARYHVNEGVFMYAFHTALLHREDAKDLMLPPLYEVNPHFYLTSDVMVKAFYAKMYGKDYTNEKPYIIEANYTGYPEPWDAEQVLSYFLEDVGMNTYNGFVALQYPSYMNETYYGVKFERRGEFYWYYLKQLYARYFLERLSHSFPDVKMVDYWKKVKVGYTPFITYPNGHEAPMRPKGIEPKDLDTNTVKQIFNYEKRIRDAIDFGAFVSDKHEYVVVDDHNGLELVGDAVFGTGDNHVSKRYYPSLFRSLMMLFGHITDPMHEFEVPPSVLEHAQTFMRDPLFFSIVKRVLHIFDQYTETLKPYTKDELIAPGVKIESVDVDKLNTFFDHFYVDMKNALPYREKEEIHMTFVRARQWRLNHKPFSYRVQVSSDKDMDAVVRVFIGPKYDYLHNEMHLDDMRKYMFEIDRFPYHLKAGKTVVERNSRDSEFFGGDSPSYMDLYGRIEKSLKGEENFVYEDNTHQCGFPERMMLPKGTKSGLPLTFYVIVSPYHK